MEPSTSPFARLLHLERDVELLKTQLAQPSVPADSSRQDPHKRHVWPADEVLLIRLLHRSPEALAAYQSPAHLFHPDSQNLILTDSESGSVFRFCELSTGDAVVWIQDKPPQWVWESDTCRRLFTFAGDVSDANPMTVSALPLFKPIVRGTKWTLFRSGEMIPRQRPTPEQGQYESLVQQLETLQRHFITRTARAEQEISDLKAELRVLNGIVERLLKIRSMSDE